MALGRSNRQYQPVATFEVREDPGCGAKSFVRVRVRSLRMFVREIAMFFGSGGMMLGVLVLASCVVVLGLMMVMRSRMVVARRGVMMLLRRMCWHFGVLLRSDLGCRYQSAAISPQRTRNAVRVSQFSNLGNSRLLIYDAADSLTGFTKLSRHCNVQALPLITCFAKVASNENMAIQIYRYGATAQ
jgi:hypothetical protein